MKGPILLTREPCQRTSLDKQIANPYRYAVRKGGRLEFKDLSKTAIENLKKLGVTCLLRYSIQAPYPPFSAPKEQCLLAFNEG